MKGFVITMALVVGFCIYLLTSYTKIGQSYIDGLAKDEGTRDQIVAAAAASTDDQAFIRHYLPFLKSRWHVLVAAEILDEDYFVKLGRETVALYDGTPVQTVEPYGSLLVDLALVCQERFKPPNEAWFLFKKHHELFPNSKKAMVVSNAISNLMVNYGMQ